MRNIKKGFTLIELLVVIAIIAILASILFPAFARARENARRTACLSNQKQLGLSIFQYSQDYDEKFPMMYNFSGSVANYWPVAVQPYLKSTQLFNCPSTPGSWDGSMANAEYGGSTDPNSGSFSGVRYGYNRHMFEVAQSINPSDWSNPPKPVSLSFINKPSETVMTVETLRSAGSIPEGGVAYDSRNYPAYRHLDTANVLFIDGHVKAMRKGDLEKKAANEDGNTLTTGCTEFVLWNQF